MWAWHGEMTWKEDKEQRIDLPLALNSQTFDLLLALDSQTSVYMNDLMDCYNEWEIQLYLSVVVNCMVYHNLI